MLTAFGYEVEDLPPLISVDEFNLATGGAYAGDPRLDIALASASGLIRMACRWHVAPNLECTLTTSASGRLLQLPALAVTDISSVTEDGRELAAGEYEYMRQGLLRRACFRDWTRTWGGITVNYSAGFDEVPAELEDLVLARVQGELALPYGVKSESAGGVSISYSDIGFSGGLSALEAMLLAPYTLPTEV